eukprot:362200-Chlamydomonas_euryale.AAC.5
MYKAQVVVRRLCTEHPFPKLDFSTRCSPETLLRRSRGSLSRTHGRVSFDIRTQRHVRDSTAVDSILALTASLSMQLCLLLPSLQHKLPGPEPMQAVAVCEAKQRHAIVRDVAKGSGRRQHQYCDDRMHRHAARQHDELGLRRQRLRCDAGQALQLAHQVRHVGQLPHQGCAQQRHADALVRSHHKQHQQERVVHDRLQARGIQAVAHRQPQVEREKAGGCARDGARHRVHAARRGLGRRRSPRQHRGWRRRNVGDAGDGRHA